MVALVKLYRMFPFFKKLIMQIFLIVFLFDLHVCKNRKYTVLDKSLIR
jgi:hypothetical protein